MKTQAQLNKLNIIVLLFIAGMSLNVHSQNQTKKKNMFVRVYDFEGKKITKGQFNFATDSILELKRGDRLTVIPIEDISYVKSKRSIGSNVLVGSIVGGVLGTIIGIATAGGEETKTTYTFLGPYESKTGISKGTGAIIGAVVGSTGGALTGLGFSVFSKSKTYQIDGNTEKWYSFRGLLQSTK